MTQPEGAWILIVDDDDEACSLLQDALNMEGYRTRTANSVQAAQSQLSRQAFDLVLSDLNLPDESGIDLCRQIVAEQANLPVILLTAFGTLDTAIAGLRAGAYDFITKPCDIDGLLAAVARALDHAALRREVHRLRRVSPDGSSYGRLIGSSAPMREIHELIEQVAPTDSTVLITGESGTGKEMVAQEIHDRSRRQRGPFVVVNCAALPDHLLESELFGHARGAFTDAHKNRVGLFLQATGGTLFLDEVGELPLSLQPKLLRVLQDRQVRPVGADRQEPVDVRIIAATNRDLESAVEAREFRDDLYYRLNVIELTLPPLRTRGVDTLSLAAHFVSHFAQNAEKNIDGLSPEAADRLLAYPFPGNVRELSNCIERCVVLCKHNTIGAELLPERIRNYQPSSPPEVNAEWVPLQEMERRYVLSVLSSVQGHRSRAAEILGIGRKTLYRKLELWGEASEGSAED